MQEVVTWKQFSYWWRTPNGMRGLALLLSSGSGLLSVERPGDGRDGLGGLRPPGVEAQVGQRLGDLRAGHAALEGATRIQVQLVVVAHRRERGYRDEAAIPRTEIGPA